MPAAPPKNLDHLPAETRRELDALTDASILDLHAGPGTLVEVAEKATAGRSALLSMRAARATTAA